MDSDVTLRVEPTAAEVATALWSYLPAAIANRRRAWTIFLMAAAVMSVVAIFGTWQIWLPAIAVTGVAVYLVVRSQRRQLLSNVSKMGLAEPSTVTADERGLRIQTDRSDQRFDWAKYEDVIETQDGVALVAIGGATVRWIPDRAFPSGKERERFLALAAASNIHSN